MSMQSHGTFPRRPKAPVPTIVNIAESVTPTGINVKMKMTRFAPAWIVDGPKIGMSRYLPASVQKRIGVIQRYVADMFAIPVSEMVSERRSRSIARPRQIAMHLSRTLTTKSLAAIGREFGGRDHTTVLHATKVVEDFCLQCPEFKAMIQSASKTLSEQMAAMK